MNHEEAFSPEGVDEQIERLLQNPLGEDNLQTSAVQVVRMLQSFYEVDLRIQRVREKLAEQMSVAPSMRVQDDISGQPEQNMRFIHTDYTHMQNESKTARTKLQYLGMIAACLVATLIVSSLAIILDYRQQAGHPADKGSSSVGKIVTAPPTNPQFSGRTLYTAPADMNDVTGLAWSPDSQRVASIRQNTVQIWDATTGKHLVTVQMTSGDEWPNALAWSGHGQQIAIATKSACFARE